MGADLDLSVLDAITDAVESGAGLHEVVRAAARALDASLVLTDRGGATVAEVNTVYEEPLRLIEYVITHDRPYTEIVTADYTISDPISAVVWGQSRDGSANHLVQASPGLDRVGDRVEAGEVKVRPHRTRLRRARAAVAGRQA